MYLYMFSRRIVISSIGEWGRKWVEGEWAHAILTFTHAKYTLANILTFTHAKYTLANVLTHAGYTMLLHTC